MVFLRAIHQEIERLVHQDGLDRNQAIDLLLQRLGNLADIPGTSREKEVSE